MFIKYYTSMVFDKQGFRDMLVQKCNIRCAVVEDGLIIDKDALNAAPVEQLPEWVKLNIKSINSQLRTRPSSEQEYEDARKLHYTMYAFTSDKATDLSPVFEDDSLEQMKQTADDWWTITHRTGYVVDNTTGEIVYES